MDNFLSGAKKQASDYAGGGGAEQAAAGGGGGGTDWSNLANLASHMGGAQEEHGSGLDFGSFASFLGKQTGGGAATPAAAAQQAGADPSVVNKLMGFYKQQTGKDINSNEGSFDEMKALAAKQLGIDIPVPILEKMIKWKLNGMF